MVGSAHGSLPKKSTLGLFFKYRHPLAFTWYIFLAPINSTSPFFLPANDLGSYLGLRAVELGMGFIILCYFVYVFVMSENRMGFFVGLRPGVSHFYFHFVQWLIYPFVGDQQAQYDSAYWFCDENGRVGEFVRCDLGTLTPPAQFKRGDDVATGRV